MGKLFGESFRPFEVGLAKFALQNAIAGNQVEEKKGISKFAAHGLYLYFSVSERICNVRQSTP